MPLQIPASCFDILIAPSAPPPRNPIKVPASLRSARDIITLLRCVMRRDGITFESRNFVSNPVLLRSVHGYDDDNDNIIISIYCKICSVYVSIITIP